MHSAFRFNGVHPVPSGFVPTKFKLALRLQMEGLQRKFSSESNIHFPALKGLTPSRGYFFFMAAALAASAAAFSSLFTCTRS